MKIEIFESEGTRVLDAMKNLENAGISFEGTEREVSTFLILEEIDARVKLTAEDGRVIIVENVAPECLGA